MIDPAAFRMYESDNFTCNPDVHTRLDRENLAEEDYVIFSPIMMGFCFGNKTWGTSSTEALEMSNLVVTSNRGICHRQAY